ncbi:MAG: MlaD family protein [Magnetovibrionaceae bacterium]
MRSSKINYLLVGLFVLGMLAALVVAVAMLSGSQGATDRYHAYYTNVTGVKFGTQVLYEGYPIGQVTEVTPEPKAGGMRFRVDFEVSQGWRIPDDSMAEIAAPSLLSAIVIAVRSGNSTTALTPGDEVPAQDASNLFAVMSDVAGDISRLADESLKPLLETLNETISGDGQRVLRDVGLLMAELTTRVPKIADDIEAMTFELKGSASQISALMSDENRGRIEKTLGNLERTSRELTKVMGQTQRLVGQAENLIVANEGDVTGAVKDMRHVTDSLSRHIDSINQNLEATARNMYEFSRQIRANPGLLLSGTQSPRAAE